MKPRTKLQYEVYALSQKLPALTNEQKQWALLNCLKHIAHRTKSNVSCLDCGHVWNGPQTGKTCVCPSCNVKLTIVNTRKKKFDQKKVLMGLLDVIGGFQVVRYFEIFSYHKSGEKPRQFIWEVVQQFFVPFGKLTIVGRNRTLTSYVDSFNGEFEVRKHHPNYWTNNKYDLCVDRIYPEMKLLAIYKRNGFTSKIKDLHIYSFLHSLETDSRLETLLKACQYEMALARTNSSNSSSINRFWNSIKICIRNGYNIKHPVSWLDYLQLLAHFNKDLNSPKYVCPKNLKRAHDLYVKRKNEVDKREAEKRKRLKALLDQKAYMENKSPYFGLRFKQGIIEIKILENVSEFIEESDIHKHCVFTNDYHQKADSLIFSAKVNGIKMETIEVSLTQMKVVQSRGFQNRTSEYNDQILDLMRKNLPKIRKRYQAVIKSKLAAHKAA